MALKKNALSKQSIVTLLIVGLLAIGSVFFANYFSSVASLDERSSAMEPSPDRCVVGSLQTRSCKISRYVTGSQSRQCLTSGDYTGWTRCR